MAAPKKTFIAACIVILAAGGFSYILRYSRLEPDRGPDFSLIPYQLGTWRGEELRFADYTYEVLQADTTTYRVYRDPAGHEMFLFIAYFRSQKYGGQIHSPRHCLPGGGWEIHSREDRVLRGDGGPHVQVNLMKIVQNDLAEYMWYWFETRGGPNASEYGLKLDLVFNSLRLKPTDAAFIRFNMMTAGDPAQTERIGQQFADELLKYIGRALPFGVARKG